MTRNFFATWSCRQVLCPKLQVIKYMVSARINSALDDSAPWPCFIFDQKLSWPFHLSLNLTQKHLLCPVITDVEDHKALFDNCPPAMVGQSCNVELYTWTAARFEMKKWHSFLWLTRDMQTEKCPINMVLVSLPCFFCIWVTNYRRITKHGKPFGLLTCVMTLNLKHKKYCVYN